MSDAALATFTDAAPQRARPADADLDLAALISESRPEGTGGQSSSGVKSSLPGRVEAAVRACSGNLRSELLDALRAEMRVEVAKAMAGATASLTGPTPPTTATVGTCPPPQWVVNTRTKCHHLVALGPDSGQLLRHWAATCSWAFGHFGGFAFSGPQGGR